MEAAILKAFPQMTPDYVRNGISYMNLILLQAAIPPYRSHEEGKKGRKGEEKNGKSDKKFNFKAFKHANELFEWF
jgi:hypothetical protein